MGELSDSAAGRMANAAGRRDAAGRQVSWIAPRSARSTWSCRRCCSRSWRSRSPSARSRSSSTVAGRSFYRASRAGYRGRTLRLLKFRKMVDGATGDALTGGRRPAVHAHGRLPRPDEARRGPAALERPARRDEPRRAAARGSELRRPAPARVRPDPDGAPRRDRSVPARLRARSPRSSTRATGSVTTSPTSCPRRCASTRSTRSRGRSSGDLRILLWTVMPVILRVDVAVNRKSGDLTVRRRPRPRPPRAA